MKLAIELEMDDSTAAHLDKMVQDNRTRFDIDTILDAQIDYWLLEEELQTAVMRAIREHGRQQARQRVEDDAQ